MAKTRVHTAKITGNESWVSLGDLRWLVKQAEGGKDDLHVKISVYKGDVREPGISYLQVDVPILETPVNPAASWEGPYGFATQDR